MRTLYENLLDINDVEASVEPITMIDNWCKDNISGNFDCNNCTSLKSHEDISTHIKGKIYSNIQ